MSFVRTVMHMTDMRYVGTCPTCMRISFLLMILSWCCSLGLFSLGLYGMWLSFVASLVFSMLWLLHIARRALLFTRHNRPADASRRLAMRYALALAGAAAVSLASPWQAKADSGCGGWAGNSGCEPCYSQFPNNGWCMRQTSDCGCYYCHSCSTGSLNCPGNC